MTGSRADYGLLYWLMQGLKTDPRADLRVLATGMHMSDRFGRTVNVIQKDGFEIANAIDMGLEEDSPQGIARSMGNGLPLFVAALEEMRPEILVLLGDRFELLAMAQAAMLSRVPIAHIHGGEATEGLIDEAIRHSVTKMSHLHFVSTEEYRERVIQLGEAPNRVFNVGAPGIDQIQRLSLLSKDQLGKEIGFALGEKYFLVTYHPVTLAGGDPTVGFRQVVGALENFPDHQVLFTAPNADTDSHYLLDFLKTYVSQNGRRCYLATSLGQLRYLSAVKNAIAVVGNSSSGIIEAPALHVPTVNVGDRQRGRLRPGTVIDAEENREQITHAIQKALSVDFRKILPEIPNPYGNGGASERILETLLTFPLDGILLKKFYDLKGAR